MLANILLLVLFLYFATHFIFSAIALIGYITNPLKFRAVLIEKTKNEFTKKTLQDDEMFAKMVNRLMFRTTIFPVFAYFAFYYMNF